MQALRLAAVRRLPTLVLAFLRLNLRLQEAIAVPKLTRAGLLAGPAALTGVAAPAAAAGAD